MEYIEKRHHVMISGTGRSGTSFLVELFTHLGFDTGYGVEDLKIHKSDLSHGGLEKDIRLEDAPYIIKNPWLCDHAEDVFSRDNLVIDHLFVPIRELKAAAESRRRVSKMELSRLSFKERLLRLFDQDAEDFAGGTWHTRSLKNGRQEAVLQQQLYNLLFTAADYNLPVTFIRFPRLTKDPVYLHRKLSPVLNSMPLEEFQQGFQKAVQPELVHRLSDRDH